MVEKLSDWPLAILGWGGMKGTQTHEIFVVHNPGLYGYIIEIMKYIYKGSETRPGLANHATKQIQIMCSQKSNCVRGLVPNFHIHTSVSDLSIPRIGPPILLQLNRQTDRGNI